MKKSIIALDKEIDENGPLSPDNRVLLKYINDTPELLSLLYDVNLMPEQCKIGSREEYEMATIALAWLKQEKECNEKIADALMA